MVIVLCEPMGFIPNSLNEFASGIIGGQFERFFLSMNIDDLFFFRNGGLLRNRSIHLSKYFLNGMQLPDTAINQYHVRPEFLPC